jgi:hypothetical protein
MAAACPVLVFHSNFGVADLHCSNVSPIAGLLQNRSSKNLVSAKFSLSHAAISAPQLLDCEALLASL